MINSPLAPTTFTVVLPLVTIAFGVVYLRSVLKWNARKRGLPLPPGPPRLPIFGNLFNAPKHKPWLGYRDICTEYGDIIYLEIFGNPILVIRNAEAATEFLEKCSANTSSRPQTPLTELIGQEYNLALMPYGQEWRQHRRVFWQHFHPGMVPKYQSTQRDVVHKFLARLEESPSRLQQHIRNSFAGTMLKVLYGIDAADENDEHVRLMNTAIETLAHAAPGDFAVERLPFLRHVPSWFPGAGFQRILSKGKVASVSLKEVPFTVSKGLLRQTDPPPCVAGNMFAKAKLDIDSVSTVDEDIFKSVCAVAFEAGSDTSYAILHAVFVALALHPDVQKKAQAELDMVVGPSRLPDYSDSDALVYVNALVKEVMRWHVVGPLGVPHSTVADAEFRGYFIPAGTIVLANIWEMLHDPMVYSSPDEFCPERFIRDGKLDSSVPDPSSVVFGFGRRICPGRYFAQSSLFIAVASVLHTFDVSLQLDEAGHPVHFEHEQTHGLISYPVDGGCTIKPRSAEAVELIRDVKNNPQTKI
ncbi:CyP450 monooxygenase [Trametes meyenii]|nr:CyP450 monooxygenase [Trametes meyenii]